MTQKETENNSSEQNPKNETRTAHKHEGSLYNRFFLMFLSLMFSGWGEWQAGHKIKGGISVILPIILLIAAAVLKSAVLLYISILLGIFTGPLLITLPLSLTGFLPPLTSPVFLFGLPVKILILLDCWFWGGKKKKKPLVKKTLFLFSAVSLTGIIIFLIKFSFFTVSVSPYTPMLKSGDLVLIINKTSFPFIQSPPLARGNLVLAKYGSNQHLVRILALPGDKVTLFKGKHLSLTVKVSDSAKYSIQTTENNEPCVTDLSETKHAYCKYYYEKLGDKGRWYIVAYPPSKSTDKFVTPLTKTFTVPEDKVLVMPDNRFFLRNKNLIKISDIKGFPEKIIWSSTPHEGIIWHRIGRKVLEYAE